MTPVRVSAFAPTTIPRHAIRKIERNLFRLIATTSIIVATVSVSSAAPPDISGVWTADDGGTYYVREFQNEVWWLGWSPASSNDFHKGIGFSNVFQGVVSEGTITGEWADVPRGQTLGAGSLKIAVLSPTELSRISSSGGFSGSRWQKSASVPNQPELSIRGVFDLVKKNQNATLDHSLLDNLRPAKRFATFFGNVVLDPTPDRNVHLNYPAGAGRNYGDFICLNNNDSPPDGDLNIAVAIDRTQLDSQGDFFDVGWEIWDDENPEEASNVLRTKISRFNEVHGESIMFGRAVECNDGNYEIPPLLPGWQESDSNSVLVNGIPLNGRIGATQRDSSSMNVFSLLMEPIGPNTHLRMAGALVLDCGHRDDIGAQQCDEADDPSAEGGFQNQEIHPIYAIDLIQDFSGARPGVNLTGVWAADDVGTYYVRQIRDTVWWLGISQDQGRRFANIFKGTVQGGTLKNSETGPTATATLKNGSRGMSCWPMSRSIG
jgi:hypothetical protein